MARMECRECGTVSAKPINCARCGGDWTMHEVDDEKAELKDQLAAARAQMDTQQAQFDEIARASDKAKHLLANFVSAYLGGNTVRTVDRNSPRFQREQKARLALESYVAALEAVAEAARHLKRVHEAGNDAADARSALWCALAAFDAGGGATVVDEPGGGDGK